MLANSGTSMDASAQAEPAAPTEKARQTSGRIVVTVQNFRNDVGDALFALFRSDAGFPEEPLRAERRVATAIARAQTRVVFEDVEPGVFAISVLHDEDRNRKVKTGIFGIPREGIGFSRDARGRMGPPKFEDAQLTLEPGGDATVTIHMHYY
ncbi:MAG: DUF2141 domain-containing protein [Myxococcales bacterium]